MWKPVDVIVFTLTVVICVCVFVGTISPLFYDGILDPKRTQAIAAILASLISIVSVYVGFRARDRDEDPPQKDRTNDEGKPG